MPYPKACMGFGSTWSVASHSWNLGGKELILARSGEDAFGHVNPDGFGIEYITSCGGHEGFLASLEVTKFDGQTHTLDVEVPCRPAPRAIGSI
jgi:hypothetical protein